MAANELLGSVVKNLTFSNNKAIVVCSTSGADLRDNTIVEVVDGNNAVVDCDVSYEADRFTVYSTDNPVGFKAVIHTNKNYQFE